MWKFETCPPEYRSAFFTHYNDLMNLGEAYLNHYKRYLGDTDPGMHMIFRHNGAAVQVSDYPGAMRGTHVLTSLGLTHYQDVLRDVIEVVVPISELDEVVMEAVTTSLSFLLHLKVPVEGVSYLRHLHRSVPAFFERYGKSALAFTDPYPFPDEFARLRLEPSGRLGKIWMGFFVAEAEVQFIEREGFDAFTTLLEEQCVDVMELTRLSIL